MEYLRMLETIQKENKLNKVYSVGEQTNGAFHEYAIFPKESSDGKDVQIILFQNGPQLNTSRTGVLDVDLLEIVRDRLNSFL